MPNKYEEKIMNTCKNCILWRSYCRPESLLYQPPEVIERLRAEANEALAKSPAERADFEEDAINRYVHATEYGDCLYSNTDKDFDRNIKLLAASFCSTHKDFGCNQFIGKSNAIR